MEKFLGKFPENRCYKHGFRYLNESKLLPTISSKQPQLNFCLFQQKIEMLQYCIRCKIKREDRVRKASRDKDGLIDESSESKLGLIDTNSDEEFFDAIEEVLESFDQAERHEEHNKMQMQRITTL